MKKFRSRSLGFQLTVMAVCILLVVTAIIADSMVRMREAVVEENRRYTQDVMHKAEWRLQQNLSLAEDMLNSACYNRNVADYLLNQDPMQVYPLMRNLDADVLSIRQLDNDLTDVIILGENGNRYFSNGRTEQLRRLMESEPDWYQGYRFGIHLSGDQVHTADTTYFGLAMPLYDFWNERDTPCIGRMIFLLDSRAFGLHQEELLYDTSLFLIQNDGLQILAEDAPTDIGRHMRKQLQTMRIKSEKGLRDMRDTATYFVRQIPIECIDATLIALTSKEIVLGQANWARNTTVLFLLMALALFSVMLWFFIRNTVRPLMEFSEFLSQMGHMEHRGVVPQDKHIQLTGYREVEIIAHEFNKMSDENDRLTQRLMEMRLCRKQAELDSLRNQINPHFLYNTLEVIVGMALEEGAEETADLILSLSRMFKYNVKGADRVSVQQEYKMVEAYTHIQKVRFGDKVTFALLLSEQAAECPMPKMVLQPLVENAVRHGIEQLEGHGSVQVCAFVEQDMLHLVVEDNGVGMVPAVLRTMRSAADAPAGQNSVGAYNVLHRLRLIYGDGFHFTIDSAPGMGTRIELSLPADGFTEGGMPLV